MLDLLLALSPVLIIFILVVGFNQTADKAGAVALAYTFALCCLYFSTAPSAAVSVMLAGFTGSLPISLIFVVCMLQINIMTETGAVKRISIFFKCFAPSDRSIQILLYSTAVGTILTAMGGVPLILLPPVFIALGFSPFYAIALPCMGYSGGGIFSLFGLPMQLLNRYTELDAFTSCMIASKFMFIANFGIGICCLWLVGRTALVRQGFIPAILTGLGAWLGCIVTAYSGVIPLGGIFMGLFMVLFYALYLKIRGLKVYDKSCLLQEEHEHSKNMPLWRAISSWIFISVAAILINTPSLPFHNFLSQAIYLEFIPGKPEAIRPFGETYVWMTLCILVCTPLMRASKSHLKAAIKMWIPRVYKPTLGCLTFFAISYLFNNSGYDANWNMVSENNIVLIISAAAVNSVGPLYVFCAPFLGLMGGMLTGSNSMGVVMFSTLHMKTAALVGSYGPVVATSSAVGACIAGMISPMKILSASAALDCANLAPGIVRALMWMALILTVIISVNGFVVDFFC
ncbi:L-lactate permease [Desulfovibrio sp. OttesenSCG-928-F07]|nr:L-lactate permease [Desulfovibrio sp. OttesenSCG-928-F07]